MYTQQFKIFEPKGWYQVIICDEDTNIIASSDLTDGLPNIPQSELDKRTNWISDMFYNTELNEWQEEKLPLLKTIRLETDKTGKLITENGFIKIIN